MCDATRCSPWMFVSQLVNGTCCARGRLLSRPEEEEANKNGLCNPVGSRGSWKSRNTWTLRNPARNRGSLRLSLAIVIVNVTIWVLLCSYVYC